MLLFMTILVDLDGNPIVAYREMKAHKGNMEKEEDEQQ